MASLIQIEAIGTGPLFDGTGQEIVQDWLNTTVDDYARRGLDQIQFWMHVYFREQTPYYSTQMTVEPVGDDRVIHDRGVIYGPWLAGKSRRNQTTRFKGYPHWRRTVQYLEPELSPAYLERGKDDLLNRLGGT